MRNDLSEVARAEIEALEAEGIQLTASEVLKINAIGHKIETPAARLALSRGVPVSVGGSHLWPLTLAASDWFQTVGGEMRGEHRQTLALAYAMAHGRAPMPYDPREAWDAIKAWAKTLTCRHAELVEAIRQVVQQDDMLDTDEPKDAATAGDISAMMAAMTKTDPAIWEYQCSISYVVGVINAIIAQNTAEGKATNSDPRIRAERAMGLVVHRIRKRHEKQAAQ